LKLSVDLSWRSGPNYRDLREAEARGAKTTKPQENGRERGESECARQPSTGEKASKEGGCQVTLGRELIKRLSRHADPSGGGRLKRGGGR